MTFDLRESSRDAGEPVEGYLFSQGPNFWRFTSSDANAVLPAGTFEPAVVSRGELRHTQEDGTGALEVKVPRDNPVARVFIPFPPTTAVNLFIYRAHRGEETDAKVVFSGRVASARFNVSEATLRCVPTSHALNQRVPKLRFGSRCNWALYGPGCQADRNLFRDSVLVTTVAGTAIRGAAFALKPSGWYENGWVEAPDGELRFCVDHVTDTLTLIAPFTALVSGDVVVAYAGCVRDVAVCVSKFANLPRHYGFPFGPNRNPHEGRIL